MSRYSFPTICLVLLLLSSSAWVGGQTPPKGQAAWPSAERRYPWETAEDQRLRSKLQTPVATLEYDSAPLDDVIENLRSLSGANIKVNWSAMGFADIDRDHKVTLSVQDVKVERAIRLVLDFVADGAVDLGYELSDGVLVISTRNDLNRRPITVVYDCDDLLNVEEKHLAAYVNRVFKTMAAGGGRDLSKDPEAAERVLRSAIKDMRDGLAAQLVKTIMTTVEPESWKETGGNVGSLER